ncbi:Arf family guanine nucleotide exchange factor GEA2 Ecym_1365 [Eremothecium cymbalariae DBVPG|uniref:SEC7 domain-containing protein n=1 Tax=Eremothecium cymbalariae (strain CBS 270.75 / DBVPG 7215 / KCTC 17166 / NRRL Y-17582) TaxID=931890 RepID=G8JND4_ERECY|nr:hypothetical protein Ecym_1365 [Eremothecium cymbalariae DBVPG\
MGLQDVAVDPVTIVIKECMTLSTAMRKYTRYASQSGVAALLGGGSEIFSNQDNSLADTFNNLSSSKHNDPLLSGFIQLRLMLNNLKSLSDVDSLTVLQPFLLVISTGTTSGYITSLALDSIQKILNYNIINENSKNYVGAIRQTVSSLTHCRFEGSEQLSDDSVLLKVLSLIETIVVSNFGSVLSDSLMNEVIQTVISLACNKRRSEVLRKAAEMSMLAITVKIFHKLKYIEPSTTQKYINDESFSTTILKEDLIGTNENPTLDSPRSSDIPTISDGLDGEKAQHELKREESIEENYGLPLIKDYLGILISLIVVENSHKQSNSTKVFGLHLLNTAIEVAGDKFPEYPRLFSLVSDPIFKHILFLIQNSDKWSLLQAALQLFTTVTIILGNRLQSQIELTLESIFGILLDEKKGADSKLRPSAVKELLIEQISILWTRSPSFFTSIFIKYDCDLDRSDLAINFLKGLSKLALPESALTTADSVPPICLEGLISVIDDMYNHMQNSANSFNANQQLDILTQRERKTEFIKCVEEFNKKPSLGITSLIEKGFIKSSSEDDIAAFLFENNGRLNKKTIGEYLANPAKISLLKKFIDLFDFKDLRVDEAIRILLTKFRLPGEAQQIERVVESFSAKYVDSQDYSKEIPENGKATGTSEVQPDADSVFILSYSIIMLNTDLHNPQVKKHMTLDDYTYNLKGCNNQKDFPMWYLEKIYYSIRDKEIVMPEEHHGNERWFDDAWNNLISSTTVITEVIEVQHDVIEDFGYDSLLFFDKCIFDHVGSLIVSTLFKIFDVASDDHISTRMLTTIDKCSQLSGFFGFNKLYNEILLEMIKITTLTGERRRLLKNYEFEDIPVVQIHIEDTMETIVVSSISVRLGQDFKGQLSTVVLSRILQNNQRNPITEDVWRQLINVTIILYENLMINPNIYPDLQQVLSLEPLPKPSAEYEINKSKYTKGLFSTFASYLKGDEEPTEEEISWSLKGLECILNSKFIISTFRNKQNLNPDIIRLLLDSLKMEYNSENSRFFESEILFMVELAVYLFHIYNHDEEYGSLLLNKLDAVCDIRGVSKDFFQRLLIYKIFIITKLRKHSQLLGLIKSELLFKNELYDSAFFSGNIGDVVLNKLLLLASEDKFSNELLNSEEFWKLLRKYASLKQHVLTIYNFLDVRIIKHQDVINGENFMWLLGLLDEISSIGAVGGQWEEEYERLIKSGHKVDKENPYQEIVEISLKSINLTAQLINVKQHLVKAEMVALVQALAHQCLNPCYQLRLYALSSLEDITTRNIILSNETISVSELFEHGLFPLIDSRKNVNTLPLFDIMSVLSKVYLYHLKRGETNDETYMKVQNIFNKYMEHPKIEEKLQELITAKKEIEKELQSSTESAASVMIKENSNNSTTATDEISGI